MSEELNTASSKAEAESKRVELTRVAISPDLEKVRKWSKFCKVEGSEIVVCAQPFVSKKLTEAERAARDAAKAKERAEKKAKRQAELATAREKKAVIKAEKKAEGQRLRNAIKHARDAFKKNLTNPSMQQALISAETAYEEFKKQ